MASQNCQTGNKGLNQYDTRIKSGALRHMWRQREAYRPYAMNFTLSATAPDTIVAVETANCTHKLCGHFCGTRCVYCRLYYQNQHLCKQVTVVLKHYHKLEVVYVVRVL